MNLMENESIRTTIQKLNPGISLNQQSFLLDVALKFDKSMWNEEEAKTKFWKNTEFLSEKKYKWLLALYFTQRNENTKPDDAWLARDTFAKEINQLINL